MRVCHLACSKAQLADNGSPLFKSCNAVAGQMPNSRSGGRLKCIEIENGCLSSRMPGNPAKTAALWSDDSFVGFEGYSTLFVSIVLTVVINLLPMIFPKSSARVERTVHKKITDSIERRERGNQPSLHYSWGDLRIWLLCFYSVFLRWIQGQS